MGITEVRSERRKNNAYATAGLFTSSFLVLLSLFSMRYALPIYVCVLGGRPFEIGLYMSMLTIASVVVRPFAGYLMDRYGPRVFFLSSGTIAVLASLGYLLIHSLLGVSILSAIVGFAHGLQITSALALFLELASGSVSTVSMINVAVLAVVAAMGIVPLIALSIPGHWGFFFLYLLLTMIALLGLAVSARLYISLPGPRQGVNKSKPAWTGRLWLARHSWGPACSIWDAHRARSAGGSLAAFRQFQACRQCRGVLYSFQPCQFRCAPRVPSLMCSIGLKRLVAAGFATMTLGLVILVRLHSL